MRGNIWAVLGLAPTNDEREIRRAYARKLKTVHPEDDPEGFQALRQAHDEAMRMAKGGWAVPVSHAPASANDGPDGPDGAADWDDPEDYDAYDDQDWGDDLRRDWSPRYDDRAGSGGWRDEAAGRDWNPQTIETRSGWQDDQKRDWTDTPQDAGEGWTDDAPPQDRWRDRDRPDPALRAELEREREQARRHAALCDALQDYLKTEAVEPAIALEKLLAVLRSPAMDSLQTHARTERWLADVLTYGGPGSETLIEPAIHFFGWQQDRIGVDLSYAQGVIQRRDALKAVQALSNPTNADHYAWKALKRRPGRFSRLRQRLDPGLASAVAKLLARMNWEMPQLEQTLDAVALADWRRHLSRPRLPALFLWTLFLAPPLLGLIFASRGDFGPFDWRVAGAIAVTAAALLFGGGMAYLHGVVGPTRVWINDDPWRSPVWLRFGWAGAALTLPVLGWILPPGPLGLGAIIVLSLVLAGWTRVVTSHLSRPSWTANPWLHAGLAPGFVVMLMPLDALWPQATLGLAGWIGVALVFTLGASALNEEWTYLAVARRRLGGLALTMAVLALSALLLIAPAYGLLGVATGLTGAIYLADRSLAWQRDNTFLTARRYLLRGGWILASLLAVALPIPAGDAKLGVALCLWLLACGLLTGLSNALDGMVKPRPKSKTRKKPSAFA